MNTLEVKIKNKISNYDNLWKYAKKQFLDYEKLEGRNWKEYDFSIDCAEDQMLFKDMLQIRCVEELTEASIAFKNGEKEHFYEEITDSLNFLLSGMVMIDFEGFKFELNKEFVPQRFDYLNILDIEHSFYQIIESIGKLCNLLKNRPWAQSNYLVSMVDFNNYLLELIDNFEEMLMTVGLDDKMLFELFERKYTVNKWRITTGY